MPASQALVVGASSEIGAAIAARLAGRHQGVHLWGRDLEALTTAARACEPHAARTDVVDVLDDTQLRAALDRVLANGPLSTVVWVAGLFDWALADDADPATWHRLIDVNLTAAAVLTAMAAPALVAAAPSTLVYLGSGAAHQAFSHNAAYVASKHGLAGLARAVFLDLRDRGVTVSLVSPGLVAAGGGLLSPQGQTRPADLIQVADVADAVEYVVASPPHLCPAEIRLSPQRS